LADVLLNEVESRGIAQKVIGFVKADDGVVTVESGLHSYLRFAANAFQTSGSAENLGVTVRVWNAKRRGEAFTNELSDSALKAAVEQAEAVARLAPIDAEYLPTLGPQVYKPTAAFSNATANISLTDRARQISEAIEASEKAGVVSAGFHQIELSARADATRNGNFNYQRTSLISLGMTARMPDGTSSGYFLRNHFDAARFDTARVAREAIRRAVESRGAKPLPPGRYPVILEAQAVADLLPGTFIFDARASDEGRGPFSAAGGRTRVGEQVFDERINILSDPWRPELPGAHAAQDGIPAQVVYLVRNGVLETLVNSRYWATQKNRPPTPGPVNRILESSAAPVSVDEMITASPRALLVGRFWYIRGVDPRTATMTGLTRDGVWYIEDGKIQHAVRNFRFNQSIIQLLAPGNVEMIGAPERVGGSEGQGGNAVLLPALKVRAFNFTSQSEAV
jgi:predicted Zn-dependent protease